LHLQELGWTARTWGVVIGGGISAAFVIGVLIGLNADSIYYGMFVPAGGRFNIAAAGDWGCGRHTLNTVENIKSQNPEVVLALGDLSYQGFMDGEYCNSIGPGDDPYFPTSQWFDIVSPIIKKMKFVVGNHDLPIDGLPDLLRQYQLKFGLCSWGWGGSVCKTFDHFNQNGVHFLIIDSEHVPSYGDSNYRYVEEDLKEAHSDLNIKWIIVAFHTPMYASWSKETLNEGPGLMTELGGYYYEYVKMFRDTYHHLFDEYGVDLVLQGHAHDYQRTYPLAYTDSNSPPTIVSAANNTYGKSKGEIYLTIGTAGVGLDKHLLPLNKNYFITEPGVVSPTKDDERFFAKVDQSDYGFLDLELSEDQSTLTGIFYSNDPAPDFHTINGTQVTPAYFRGFPTMGHKVVDYFTIKK